MRFEWGIARDMLGAMGDGPAVDDYMVFLSEKG